MQAEAFSAEELLDELLSRETGVVSASSVLKDCFPEQLAFIRDRSPLKGAFCTRRAAKSYSVALDMISDSFEYPRAHYLILGLNRAEMKDIWWDNILKAIDDRYHLGAVFNETELTMRMPNGALIRIAGADANEREKDKFLGGRKRKIAIDEAQSWGTDLERLIMGVLKPSVADYRGQIIVVGTPGNLVHGFFHRLTNESKAGKLSPASKREPGWSIHTWTTFHNTAVVDQKTGARMCERWGQEIEDLKAANPLVIETSWFRQHYLGEWVVDESKLVYKFLPGRNEFEKLPVYSVGFWSYVLGIDLGNENATAFVVMAYHSNDPCLYILESFKEKGYDFTDVANKVRYYQGRFSFDTLVIDGANKQGVEEMRRRHDLPLTAAEKQGKYDYQQLMNDDFIQKKVKLRLGHCDSLADEYATLLKDPKDPTKELATCENHCADAALYGWRHCYSYLSTVLTPAPAVGTREHAEAEAERLEEQAIERLREEQNVLGLPAEVDELSSEQWDPFITEFNPFR